MNYKFIVIEGNIGAGKTTLATKIAQTKNAKLILEQFSDNPFLPDFYKDPERYSFILEMSFLADRYTQLVSDVLSPELFKSFIIADYYFSKSLIFAKTTLKEQEYKLYRKIFDIIYTSLPKPDLYVYLHSSVDRILQNIAKRGREYEKNITAEYLNNIQQSYFNFFKQNYNKYRFLIIDTDGIDFVKSQEDFDKIEEIIFNNEYKIGINRVIL